MMDYIEYNPSLRLQFKVKQNKRIGSLSHEQKKELLEKSKVFPHLYLAILIAMTTGLRKGEILALQWTWIDLNKGTLRIPPENTKNRKGFYIALSSKLLEILKKERLERPQSTHVIEYYGNPIKDNVKHSFDRVRKQLSFQYLADGERFTFHHLRHTFATELAQSGLPLVEVKNALNHSDIQTTLRYAHSTGKGVVEAIDKMSEGLV